MTIQVRNYYKNYKKSDLVYVIPKCCGKWLAVCKWNKCFSALKFHIRHKNVDDLSKVTYKVFIKRPLGSKVFANVNDDKECYLIADRTYCTNTTYSFNCDFPPQQPVGEPFII